MSNILTKDLGVVAPVPKGNYNSGAYYDKLNMVYYDDATYMAIKPSTGIPPTNTEYWQFISGDIRKQDIVDNLDSTATNKPLSAKQGKILNEEKPTIFNNVTEMKDDASLKNGMTVQTLGYYQPNDGGGRTYNIREKSVNDTIDEEYIIGISDEIVAELIDKNIYTEEYSVERFYDETDESEYFITQIPYRNYKGEQNVWQLGIGHDNTTDLNDIETTIDFANRKGATVCINAGIFARGAGTNLPHGVLIMDGEVLQDQTFSTMTSDTLGIKEDGTFVTFNSATVSAQQLLDAGAINAFTAFRTLIKDGVSQISGTGSKGPRQIIAQKPNKDYVILTASGRLKETPGLTLGRVIEILIQNYGVDFAYELDGGGSVSTVIKGQKINENIDNKYEYRKVITFLYMGKSEIANRDLNTSFHYISNLRQKLIKDIITFHDVWYGYLKLYAPTNSPGIEFYQDDEINVRSGKLYLNNSGLFVRQRTTLDDTETEQMLFQVTRNGITYLDKMFGNFYDYCINNASDTDLNDIDSNGFYIATSNTQNVPEAKNFIVLHVNTGSTKQNKVQFAFPMKDAETYIYSRRKVQGSNTWKDWEVIGGFKAGNTTNRPSANIRTGQIYFDTTLGKPIWYDGTNWVDATGTQV